MLNNQLLNDLSIKIRDLAKGSPVGDIENNIRALLQGAFTKLALVSREEFDVQADLMRVTREKLQNLESKLSHLEEMLQKNNKINQE
ncbi:MAG: accessory factor UbiK family protein [Methylophilaceae bacterium]|nr:accessory factor UbiK family protein [Methyloradius sp.]